jgi:hypothetical protein
MSCETKPNPDFVNRRYEDEQTDEWDGEPVSDQWASVSESYLDQVLTTEPGSTRASVDYGIPPNHPGMPIVIYFTYNSR